MKKVILYTVTGFYDRVFYDHCYAHYYGRQELLYEVTVTTYKYLLYIFGVCLEYTWVFRDFKS